VMLDMMIGHHHGVGQLIDILGGGGSSISTRLIDYHQTGQTLGPISDGVNGKPNTGPENRPVSGSKLAFIYTED